MRREAEGAGPLQDLFRAAAERRSGSRRSPERRARAPARHDGCGPPQRPADVTYEKLVASVGIERYRAACEWAWRTAEGTGEGRGLAWPSNLDEVPHDLADAWYDESTSLSEKLDLALRVYKEMPSYATLMYMKDRFADLDDVLRQRLWAAFRAALDSDDRRVADPVSYVLWVDFFEDEETVEEAWREMTRRDLLPWESRLRRVLDNAGPVPWPQKEALFEQLAADTAWHPHLVRALIGSAFDVYGQLDATAASRWLERLRLSDDVPGLPELRQKLNAST